MNLNVPESASGSFGGGVGVSLRASQSTRVVTRGLCHLHGATRLTNQQLPAQIPYCAQAGLTCRADLPGRRCGHALDAVAPVSRATASRPVNASQVDRLTRRHNAPVRKCIKLLTSSQLN